MRVHSFFLTGRKTCPGHDPTLDFTETWLSHFGVLGVLSVTVRLAGDQSGGTGGEFLQKGAVSERNVEVKWRVLRRGP